MGAVIVAVDPAFKKCGFAIISKDKGEYIESF
jgi:Holliday junction resolvasome RuvABC endonuclease subunit